MKATSDALPVDPFPDAGYAPATFALLDDNAAALMARLELCRTARETLDLQCYIFRDDGSGRRLAEAMVAAAGRGVRVRLLLDDLDAGDPESVFGRMDAHPGCEVRLFNRFAWRGLLRPLAWLRDPARLSRRMHAKALVADGGRAIVGGRNVGDEYFSPDAELAFADIDVMMEGPVVAEVARSFERHWVSRWARPLSAARQRSDPRERIRQARRRVARGPAHVPARADAATPSRTFVPGRGQVFADLPSKVDPLRADPDGYFGPSLQQLVAGAQEEVVIMTPYLVPRAAGMAFIRSLRERGVCIRLLTNSLAATDVVAVHAGYRRYRRALLELGVELYEYRPTGFWGGRLRRIVGGAKLRASLHAKTLVVDERLVMIGSANLDPRSHQQNVELGVVIDSGPLARAVHGSFEDAIKPGNAWRLLLEDGRVRWQGAGVAVEPDAGLGRRLCARLLGLLPLEGHL